MRIEDGIQFTRVNFVTAQVGHFPFDDPVIKTHLHA
jgi:hypothetical protein